MQAYCEDCGYKSKDFDTERETVGDVSLDGGYFMSDKKGGSITKCPSCGQDTLALYD